MSLRTLGSLLALMAATGCSGLFDQAVLPTPGPEGCQSDLECADGEVCFADGCGDPGKGLVVEVTVNASTGHYEQDFTGDDLKGFTAIIAEPPSRFGGTISRQPQGSTEPAPYTAPLTLIARGESVLLPGVPRSYELTTSLPQSGQFALPVGSGRYSLTITAADPTLPPITFRDRSVSPGESQTLDIALPMEAALIRVRGTLVRRADPVTPLDAKDPIELQAHSPDGSQALSQRASVDMTTGEFELWLGPSALMFETFTLEARPRSPQSLLPTKRFSVPVDPSTMPVLELGDYDSPVELSGRVVGSDTLPISNATVFVEGRVGPDAEFRSVKVLTDADGRFSVSALPNTELGFSYAVWVFPPSEHFAAVYRGSVRVAPGNSTGKKELGELRCLDKVQLSGTILLPSGAAADRVKVTATALSTDLAIPLPEGATTTSNEVGGFFLTLEPGLYRLDFVSALHPRSSRFVDVNAEAGPLGTVAKTITLRDQYLSAGHRAAGTIRWRSPERGLLAAPNAVLRIFRVGTTSGMATAYLVAEGIADVNGNFSVLLPTR